MRFFSFEPKMTKILCENNTEPNFKVYKYHDVMNLESFSRLGFKKRKILCVLPESPVFSTRDETQKNFFVLGFVSGTIYMSESKSILKKGRFSSFSTSTKPKNYPLFVYFGNFSESFSIMVLNVKNHDLFDLNIRNINFFFTFEACACFIL